MAVYYVCSDRAVPAGGIKVVYRHVDVLNRNGIEAFVLHERPPFRCTWFENDTPIRYWLREPTRPNRRRLANRVAGRLGRASNPAAPRERIHLARPPELPFAPDDVLVVPEGFGHRLAEIAPGLRKVIFNQNAYRTFHGYPAEIAPHETPYRHPDVLKTIVISEDNRRYLVAAFPGAEIVRLHYSYDPARFPFAEAKPRLITYMPRKNRFDAEQVLLLLRLRDMLDGWEVRPIDGATEAETSSLLQSSTVFFSFGHPEGCPLPPAEAMLAGAIVVGYHGMGGREYFRSDFAYPVPFGDVQAFAETAESVLAAFASEPEAMAQKARAACAFIRATYSREREERELVAFWRELLGG